MKTAIISLALAATLVMGTKPTFEMEGIENGGDTILGLPSATGTVANHIQISNSISGEPPLLCAVGSDTNVDLELTTKGTGRILVNGKTLTLTRQRGGYIRENITTTLASSRQIFLGLVRTDATIVEVRATIDAAPGNSGDTVDFDIYFDPEPMNVASAPTRLWSSGQDVVEADGTLVVTNFDDADLFAGDFFWCEVSWEDDGIGFPSLGIYTFTITVIYELD